MDALDKNGLKRVWEAIKTRLADKVDKVSGKGLSTNDYTTAEKTKLVGIESGAQVNEVTAAQYHVVLTQANALKTENEILRKRLENLLSGLEIPIYKEASGMGIVEIEDAAEGQIKSVTVDKSLAGKTLYIQLISTGKTLISETVTVDSNGVAPTSFSTLKGRNILYLSTMNYGFDPSSFRNNGVLTVTNYRINENKKTAYDNWTISNAVMGTVRYLRDLKLGEMLDCEISYKKFLALYGLGISYITTDNPSAAQSNGQQLYVKLDYYPFGTQDNPAYAKVSYPNEHYSVFYIAEYRNLS